MNRDELNKLMKQYFRKGGVVTVYDAPKKRKIGQTIKHAKGIRKVNLNPNMGYATTNWKNFTA